MPKIIKTITNNNPSGPKAWILDSEYSQYFTQEEIENVLTPFKTYMKQLTGKMSYTVEEVGNTLIIKQEFDTFENMKLALDVTSGTNINPIVKNHNNLIKNKLTQLGANLSVSISFE